MSCAVAQGLPGLKLTRTIVFTGNWLTKFPQKVKVLEVPDWRKVTTVTEINVPLLFTLLSWTMLTSPLKVASEEVVAGTPWKTNPLQPVRQISSSASAILIGCLWRQF